MKLIKLNDGNAIPVIGLGTWKSKPGEVYNAVIEAVRMGYRHIDCAHIYGNEAEIGEALSYLFRNKIVKRKDLFITSKLWNNSHEPENVRKALHQSLENLQLDYLDLYLIHWPVCSVAEKLHMESIDDLIPLAKIPIINTWREMEKAVDDGLIKSIGVSNFSENRVNDLCLKARIMPAVNQIESHPFLNQNKLINHHYKNGIVVTAYSPLGSMDRPEALKSVDEPILLEHSLIKRLARKYNASPAQILIAWQINRGVVVIPKSTNPRRLEENLISRYVEISDADMDEIDELNIDYRYLDGSFFVCEEKGYTLENFWK